jgi:hypothetical protein
MSKLLMTVLAGSLALAASYPAAAAGSKEEFKAAQDRADATYKTAREKCNAMSGNSKDVCVAEAKGEQKKAKARAEADYKGDEKSRYNLRMAMADADYEVAKERCDARTGNDKDVCLKEAKAAQTRARADAKAGRSSQDANTDAKEAARDADYRVARERCDSLSGSAKDQCVAQAKAKYGRT